MCYIDLGINQMEKYTSRYCLRRRHRLDRLLLPMVVLALVLVRLVRARVRVRLNFVQVF